MADRPVIVHLATTHKAGDPRIFQKECRTLAQAGYDVRYVVPHAHDEVVDGVQILAVATPRSGKERMTTTTWAVFRRALAQPKDAVFHFHDADLLLPALVLKALGRRVVYDLHEDVPRQVQYFHWVPERFRSVVGVAYGSLEALGAHVFDGLIVAEPVIARRFKAHAPILVRNFPLRDELIPSAPMPYAERPLHAAYVGTITVVRGIREVIVAMGQIAPRLSARLRLGGSFHPASLQEVLKREAGWSQTDYLGYLDRPAVARVLDQVRVGIVTFHPVERYLGNYPTKLFEYMAAGIPVVCSSFAQLKPFVEGTGCGLLVDPLNPASIAWAIQWLLEHPEEAEAMGQRGQAAVRERFHWAPEGESLVQFYERLLDTPRPTAPAAAGVQA
ncbi:MAG: glycosyltransferase family 4 protein [Bacteroidota bacterium]